ncbi:L,D-transpeptidase family protein [Bacillus pumilus]|uniref:L,D-transpeptidase family protein n=1 Tax=Bacillus pumilus TaxID=1408 RepID=UPI000D0419F8|nr:L,D-transpeptidase family protein [Bacillus pumilus]PRS30123.1 L,D-transpeptidase [Bacillus pumilus]
MLRYTVKRGETLASIALDFRTTADALKAANPSLQGQEPVQNKVIIIPGLPDPNTIPYRISVSISRKRLVLFSGPELIRSYPIATGRILNMTPTGSYYIVNRQPNPGGPFGAYWLSLSKVHYGIHGTNNPSSIGKAVSRGCIRMYNQNVIELASIVPNGTPVTISQ